MQSPSPRSESLKQFCGTAPLFPLPDVVAFPNALVPLQVYEPRYRAMIEDVLAGPRWLALALLEPNWEMNYDSKHAAVHPIVCLGRVAYCARLDDGRFHILFHGTSRAKIVDEPSSQSPYRTARLELLPDIKPEPPAIDREHRVHELIATFRQVVPEIDLDHVWHGTVGSDVPLGGLCDILSNALVLPVAQSQELLSETNVDLRSDLLLDRLREVVRGKRDLGPPSDFPPPFSEN